MKHIFKFVIMTIASIQLCGCARQVYLSKDNLTDKIKGGWAGQAIGCTYGGPTEFRYQGCIIPDEIPIEWPDGAMKWFYDYAPGLYDDIYMDLTFVKVFQEKGLDAPIEDFANAFADAPYPLWHANQQARYNIHHGIKAPESGYWKYNPHADDIDFQIEADYAGLMSPGLPEMAAHYSDEIGHIMNYGDGWYGGVFVAAMYSYAFVEDDINTVVDKALKMIPKGTEFRSCMDDIVEWHREYPQDWKKNWELCQQKWSGDVGCTDGALTNFDIDAKINSAYILIGLLYGEGDFAKTLEISTRCGQDSDCNPASAGGILGTMIGYDNIPDFWKKNLPEVEDRPFSFTDISLNDVYEMSLSQALEVIERAGGTVEEDLVRIPVRRPRPVRFEQSFPEMQPKERTILDNSLAQGPVSMEFNGSAAAFLHFYVGATEDYIAKVEVTLDGESQGIVELPFSFHERKDHLFHVYELPQGVHTVTFNWLNPGDGIVLNLREMLIY